MLDQKYIFVDVCKVFPNDASEKIGRKLFTLFPVNKNLQLSCLQYCSYSVDTVMIFTILLEYMLLC